MLPVFSVPAPKTTGDVLAGRFEATNQKQTTGNVQTLATQFFGSIQFHPATGNKGSQERSVWELLAGTPPLRCCLSDNADRARKCENRLMVFHMVPICQVRVVKEFMSMNRAPLLPLIASSSEQL